MDGDELLGLVDDDDLLRMIVGDGDDEVTLHRHRQPPRSSPVRSAGGPDTAPPPPPAPRRSRRRDGWPGPGCWGLPVVLAVWVVGWLVCGATATLAHGGARHDAASSAG